MRYSYIEPYLALRNSDGTFRVPLSDVTFCSSYNSSTEFVTIDGRSIVVAKPIGYYEDLLSSFGFIRIHNRIIINVLHLNRTGKGEDSNEIVLTNGTVLSVSRPRKSAVLECVKQFSIEGFCDSKKMQLSVSQSQLSIKKNQNSHKSSSGGKN